MSTSSFDKKLGRRHTKKGWSKHLRPHGKRESNKAIRKAGNRSMDRQLAEYLRETLTA